MKRTHISMMAFLWIVFAVIRLAVSSTLGDVICPGDGTGASCPCGNPSPVLSYGCANSSGLGVFLGDSGLPSTTGNTLAFTAIDVPQGSIALLFEGRTSLHPGMPFMDGLRCCGGRVQRATWRVPDVWGTIIWPPDEVPDQRPWGWSCFQVFYRDPGVSPCGTGWNFSNGISIRFLP